MMNMKGALTCLRCGHQWKPRVKRPVQCPSCHSPAWDKAPSGPNPFREVAVALNTLMRRDIIRDWVIYGAVAYAFHEQPVFTEDMDILVSVKNDQEYFTVVFPALQDFGPMVKEAATFLIQGVPVQVFPAEGNPLWEDTLHKAVSGRIGDQDVKVASREHLIILALTGFRPGKDWERIVRLHQTANKKRLNALFKRFDQDEKLRQRLGRLV